MYIYLFLSLFGLDLVQNAPNPIHDIHVSKTEVHYKSDLAVLQLSVHIFVDDLELHLEEQGYTALKLNTLKEHIDGDQAVHAYLDKHLIFKSNDKVLQTELIGKEASEDLSAIWCYVEIPLEGLDKLSLENTILLDIHDDQRNLVSFKVDGVRRDFLIMDSDSPKVNLQ